MKKFYANKSTRTYQRNNETLNYLFQGYLQFPTGLFDVAEIASKYNEDPQEFGTFLLDHGWVRNQRYLPPNSFECQIDWPGIDLVAPEYFGSHMTKIIAALGEGSNNLSVMEILGFEPKDFQRAFDIIKRVEITGFIERPIYGLNDIFVSLSLNGRLYHEENVPRFFH